MYKEMKKEKYSVFSKCLLTGFLYAAITCMIQVPVANILFFLFDLQSDTSISDDMLLFLLLSLFVVGIAMAWFYYLYGQLFAGNNKWISGLKYGIFVYLSNYIPQVFFLDANNGVKTLIRGGFPIIQVELFDFIILIITVLLMVKYMPYQKNAHRNCQKYTSLDWWKYLLAGSVFAITIIVLQEIVLPLLGVQGMADGLYVSKENRLFFYSIMIVGFVLAGSLVFYCAMKNSNEKSKNRFCLHYGIFIWCTFDLTMIPLGFGVFSTILFIFVSMIGFVVLDSMCNLPLK